MNFRIREIPFAKTSSKKIIRSQYFTQKKKEKEELENVRKPENELQTQIYECISAVLGHQRFGIDTDLYTVGLDSLGSVMLLSDLPVFNDTVYQNLLVSVIPLRKENVLCSVGKATPQGNISGSASHNLDDAAPLMGGRGVSDLVNGLHGCVYH